MCCQGGGWSKEEKGGKGRGREEEDEPWAWSQAARDSWLEVRLVLGHGNHSSELL